MNGRAVGLRPAIYPVKGVSITVQAAGWPGALRTPIRYLENRHRTPTEQRRQMDLLQEMNRMHLAERGGDTLLESRIESLDHLTFWLRRVTTHRCIDRFRRTAPRPVLVDEFPDHATADAAPDVLLDASIQRLVAELPPNARAVMLLRYQEDLDPSEIATALDMSVNTVKSHLRRSVETLREKLGVKESA